MRSPSVQSFPPLCWTGGRGETGQCRCLSTPAAHSLRCLLLLMWLLSRSPKQRNAAISGDVTFPVLDSVVGSTGLNVMDLGCRGFLTVPGLASYSWGPAFTVTAYVEEVFS
jgi:hypothetical protein